MDRDDFSLFGFFWLTFCEINLSLECDNSNLTHLSPYWTSNLLLQLMSRLSKDTVEHVLRLKYSKPVQGENRRTYDMIDKYRV